MRQLGKVMQEKLGRDRGKTCSTLIEPFSKTCIGYMRSEVVDWWEVAVKLQYIGTGREEIGMKYGI